MSDRLDAVESRLMYQDETIETLNQTITDQWIKIEALMRQVAVLSERLRRDRGKCPRPRKRTATALLSDPFARAEFGLNNIKRGVC